MNGEQHYDRAIATAAARAKRERDSFLRGTRDDLPDASDYERLAIIAEMDAMLEQISRQREVLKAAGLDGARGEAMRPQRQINSTAAQLAAEREQRQRQPR